jgi:hypothetical protein
MERMDVTPELRQAVVDSVKRRRRTDRWTWDDFQANGGPSDGTMKRFMNGSIERVDESTLTKLGDAFGWPLDVEFDLVSPDSETRRVALTRAVVGPSRKAPPIAERDRGEGWMPGQREDVLTAVLEMQKTMNESLARVVAALQPREPEQT